MQHSTLDINVKLPGKSTSEVVMTRITEGTSILVDYTEHELRQHTFISKQGDAVTCKAFRLNMLNSISVIHDFTSEFGNYVADGYLDFSHAKKIIQH